MAQERALHESFGYHFSNGEFERIHRQTVQGFQLQMGADAGGVVKVMDGKGRYIAKSIRIQFSPAGEPRQRDRLGRGRQ